MVCPSLNANRLYILHIGTLLQRCADRSAHYFAGLHPPPATYRSLNTFGFSFCVSAYPFSSVPIAQHIILQVYIPPQRRAERFVRIGFSFCVSAYPFSGLLTAQRRLASHFVPRFVPSATCRSLCTGWLFIFQIGAPSRFVPTYSKRKAMIFSKISFTAVPDGHSMSTIV